MNLAFLEGGSDGIGSGIGAVSVIGIIAGAVFFLIFGAVAYVVFRMLKRTAKLALRLVIAGIILLVAALGTVLIWAGSFTIPKPAKPPASRTR